MFQTTNQLWLLCDTLSTYPNICDPSSTVFCKIFVHHSLEYISGNYSGAMPPKMATPIGKWWFSMVNHHSHHDNFHQTFSIAIILHISTSSIKSASPWLAMKSMFPSFPGLRSPRLPRSPRSSLLKGSHRTGSYRNRRGRCHRGPAAAEVSCCTRDLNWFGTGKCTTARSKTEWIERIERFFFSF